MKRCFVLLWAASCAAWAQPPNSQPTSADLLFTKSDSAAAWRLASQELKKNPRDVNAWFVRMEAARVQLQSRDELWAAIALLQETRTHEDQRARLAAERIRELAANTPQFRRVIPKLAQLLSNSNRYSRQLSDALLTANGDGVPLPRLLRLTPRVREWQIAGPFGEFSNVDFDGSWPPEHDALRKSSYGSLVTENLHTASGKVELPEYFSHNGIYYAASELRISRAGKYKLTVESDGTFELFVNGKSILLHDSRFQAQNAVSYVDCELPARTHRVLVKLQASSLPLRVWFEPVMDDVKASFAVSEDERAYLNAATALADGDTAPALALQSRSSSISNLLRADAFSRIGEEQEAHEARALSVASDSKNLKAEFELALQAFSDENFEEAAAQLSQIVKWAPAYWPMQELKYQLADHFDWSSERQEALIKRVQLHPACGALEDTIKFYENIDHAQAARFEAKLTTCAAVPYAYWEHLSSRGFHQQALAGIDVYVAKHPNDRRALRVAVREAILANNHDAAQRFARALHQVAPNWEWAGRLASNPEGILDSPSASSTAGDFYKPYIRDALPMMANAGSTEDRVLINDRVVKLGRSGDAWIYQHTVTQIFDKHGIELVGEVEVPHSADLLIVRTINRDGTFVEPELNDNKNTVSMPSLGEGDAVEIAYVQHLAADTLKSSHEQLDFVFGSPDFATQSARLTVIRDGAPEPLLWHSANVKQIEVRQQSPAATTWEVTDVAPNPQEPAAPRYELQPAMLWLQMDRSQPSNTLARYRDQLIQATKITPGIERMASSLRGSNSEQRVAAAYQHAMASVENDSQTWDGQSVPSAQESFAQGEGSRVTALIALLSAMGFDADLEVAAEHGHHDPLAGCEGLRCYTHPLVRAVLPDSKKQILLDCQTDGLAAGALSPEVEGEAALLISRVDPSATAQITVPRVTSQQSVATANLTLDANGSVLGLIHVRFGSWRGAQMRQSLRQLSAKDREAYFEEIASRILPNVGSVSGFVKHEDDPDVPLELDLALSASSLARWNGTELEIGQLVPALGLSRLYAAAPERHEELFVEAPLIESSEFIVRLPEGVEAAQLPESVHLKNRFGEYHTEFKVTGNDLRIVRAFRIPVQEVGAADYAAFAKFALEIGEAERERIHLRRGALAQNRTSAH